MYDKSACKEPVHMQVDATCFSRKFNRVHRQSGEHADCIAALVNDPYSPEFINEFKTTLSNLLAIPFINILIGRASGKQESFDMCWQDSEKLLVSDPIHLSVAYYKNQCGGSCEHCRNTTPGAPKKIQA